MERILLKLKKSRFRNSFKLKQKDIKYINTKGIPVIESHAKDFIEKNLEIKTDNDGKQTPWKGHPVFVAQHATATCCRKCLKKWHNIPKSKILSKEDKTYIKNIIIRWMNSEMLFNNNFTNERVTRLAEFDKQ
ncbi:MAG: DUF4186 domain-containing protein [Nanobdellota archaeon]